MTDQLPEIIEPNGLTTLTDAHLVPVLIADLGDQASWCYVEFFTAHIRNPNARRAYARACARFFARATIVVSRTESWWDRRRAF